jgi:hypothetical protein
MKMQLLLVVLVSASLVKAGWNFVGVNLYEGSVNAGSSR